MQSTNLHCRYYNMLPLQQKVVKLMLDNQSSKAYRLQQVNQIFEDKARNEGQLIP